MYLVSCNIDADFITKNIKTCLKRNKEKMMINYYIHEIPTLVTTVYSFHFSSNCVTSSSLNREYFEPREGEKIFLLRLYD